MNMKNTILLAAIVLTGFVTPAVAQTTPVTVNKVITAEDNFNKSVAKKGIKEAFLEVADPEGIVFKPNAVKITDFYTNIEKPPGTLKWQPKFALIFSSA